MFLIFAEYCVKLSLVVCEKEFSCDKEWIPRKLDNVCQHLDDFNQLNLKLKVIENECFAIFKWLNGSVSLVYSPRMWG